MGSTLNIELRYGQGKLSVSLPQTFKVDEFSPATVSAGPAFADFRSEFENAGGEALLAAHEPLVIVNDACRTTPTMSILEWIDEIDPGFIDRARFLIATGSHRAPTEDQLNFVLGRFLSRLAGRLSVHDARDNDSMVSLGRDGFGAEVLLNRQVLDYHPTLVIGSVEPHYFAGYTGGRKAFFPGLTDLATIERNHNLANSMAAMPLRLDGNPVAEHLDELMAMVDIQDVMSIQMVLDASQDLAGVMCGSLAESFARGVTMAEEVFAHRVEVPYDIIFCEVLPPLDENLYQVQKALENSSRAVRDGGAVVLVSACAEGIGSQAFYELADHWDAEANRPTDGRLRFGSHKLSRVNATRRRIGVYLHSELSAVQVRRVYYEPLDNLSELSFIAGNINEEYRVAIVRDAGNTVLYL